MGISYAVGRLFDLIMLLLLISVLLSWFPGINWSKEPFNMLRKFTDIFFGPFRKVIPPIGMLDISPVVAFFVLSLIRSLVVGLLARAGL